MIYIRYDIHYEGLNKYVYHKQQDKQCSRNSQFWGSYNSMINIQLSVHWLNMPESCLCVSLTVWLNTYWENIQMQKLLHNEYHTIRSMYRYYGERDTKIKWENALRHLFKFPHIVSTEIIQWRKLFMGRNFSRAETIHENTVFIVLEHYLDLPQPWSP